MLPPSIKKSVYVHGHKKSERVTNIKIDWFVMHIFLPFFRIDEIFRERHDWKDSGGQ